MRARDWATVDFYAVLGVEPTAGAEEIALAFRALAKRLHPDRVGASAGESEQFKSVTAAYEVLGDARLRRNYDQVRIEAMPRSQPGARGVDATVNATAGARVTTMAAPSTTPATTPRTMTPEALRRNGRRWVAGGIGISIMGVLVTALITHLQIDEHARRAGRVKTEAVLVVSATRTDVRFTTPNGVVEQVKEPARVNPGVERNGQSITVLYRADRPTDVILDESTIARDITLWVVALKLLVGGVIFLVVGIRRLRRVSSPTRAP